MPDYLRDWYYMEFNWRGNSLVRGPFTLEEMRKFIQEGTIDGKTQVRCGANSYWHTLKEVSAIFSKPAPGKAKPETVQFTKTRKIVSFTVIAVIAFLCFLGIKKEPISNRPSFFREPLTKEAIIAATNQARRLQGLTELNENPLLDAIAEVKAKDMFERQYFAHVSPTGEQASDIAQRVGYKYKIIAENIARGLFLTNQKIVDGWMQSPGHRKNILSPEVREIGASVMKGRLEGSDAWVSVQVFGLPSLPVSEKSCTPPPEDLKRDIEMKKAEVQSLTERVEKLRQELDAENQSIDLERLSVGNDPKRKYDLEVKISAYNEKTEWHNQSLAQLRAKTTVLRAMAEEYDKEVQRYRDCQASD
ncbi:MAG: Cysteine-rich secretory protein family protein [Syntrophorhabdaceae bacterium PtaU1.Bin034]|jgi:uncharacterized protein YkwD|nr:MAG: Cysteine-rich secretory protein family protein [Syntrophorhabdaceae bacterium PtaU1.Bin034]